MDEKDSMTPDTIPQSTPVDGTVPAGRKNRRPVVIGVAAVAAIALVAGGVCGYRAYEIHRVSMAREACQSAVTDLNKAVKSYKALLGADATTAALKTDATSVKDAKTLDALRKAAGVETPGMVKCDASDKTGLDEATAKADKTTKGVKAGAKALESAVKAVESSKLDKTVADADGLYKATEGNVQDEKTREALKQAIAKRDAGAIAKAVKSGERFEGGEGEGGCGSQGEGRTGGAGSGHRRSGRPGSGPDAAVVFGSPTVIHSLVFSSPTLVFGRFDIGWWLRQ